MQIDYQKLIFPPELQVFVREVVDGVPVKAIPGGWTGLLIYHPATQQYYASKSTDPLKYEEIVRERIEPRWSDLAIALRKMLEFNPQYQFFVLPLQARAHIEQALANQGIRRITTRMGEAAKGEHVLYQVYSPYNKVTRFVAAPAGTPRTKLIEQANKSFAQWLASRAKIHKHERDTMRIALRSKFAPNTKVFEDNCLVAPTTFFSGRKHNEFRTILIDLNIKAIREFIQATTTG